MLRLTTKLLGASTELSIASKILRRGKPRLPSALTGSKSSSPLHPAMATVCQEGPRIQRPLMCTKWHASLQSLTKIVKRSC